VWLNVPAFVGWLLWFCDWRGLRLLNGNSHSTVSIKESASIKESTTVKATEMGLLPARKNSPWKYPDRGLMERNHRYEAVT